jgi:phosphoribosylpyrophosphate synthetase
MSVIKNAPLVCFVTDQSVYESKSWGPPNVLEKDPSVRTMFIVIYKYPDGASKPVMKGRINRMDRVILVFSVMNDVNVCKAVIMEVVRKAGCVAGLYLYTRELRADKIDKRFRLLNYQNSMADHSSSSSEDEHESTRNSPLSRVEQEYEQEILMAPHVVKELTDKIFGHFLVSHSDIVLTPNSSDLNEMMHFVNLVVENLMVTYVDWVEYAYIIVFPDFGAKHRFAEQIEVLFDALKLPVHLIACDKERDGQVTTTSLKLSDRQKSQLQQKSIVIVIDDIVRSGKTSIDALNLIRKKGHPDNKYVIACFHLPIVNDDGYTINKNIENTLVGHLNDGTLHKLYTTDSIPSVTCNLPPTIDVMPVTVRAIKDVLDAEHMW